MANSKPNAGRHVPPRPAHVATNAEPYWDLFTRTYDFEDVEAPRLALLCNLYAYAEHCETMCFSKGDGKPIPLIPRRLVSGDQDDTQNIANPFFAQLEDAQRQIERVSAALGIMVREKSPVRPSVETPVDRAARKKAEKGA